MSRPCQRSHPHEFLQLNHCYTLDRPQGSIRLLLMAARRLQLHISDRRCTERICKAPGIVPKLITLVENLTSAADPYHPATFPVRATGSRKPRAPSSGREAQEGLHTKRDIIPDWRVFLLLTLHKLLSDESMQHCGRGHLRRYYPDMSSLVGIMPKTSYAEGNGQRMKPRDRGQWSPSVMTAVDK